MIPWYYRWRFTNWLIAKPWKWKMRMIYKNLRQPSIFGPPIGPLQALWFTLTFPHVHHPNEDDDEED